MLCRSGTEEAYTELVQLLEDISCYRRDVQEALQKEEKKKQKEIKDRLAAEEIRQSAMETFSREYQVLVINSNIIAAYREEEDKENYYDDEDDFDLSDGMFVTINL